MIGISFITRACMGSGGVGLRVCWKNMVAPMMIGRMKYGSLIDRSTIQPSHGAWRISTLSSRVQYRARNTGICTRIGRQPPSGLIFSFLYSSIMPWDIFWRSSPYCSLRACSLGATARMRAMDL
ncbi:hypothetical protein D3C80_1052740 [compost metagenome]